MKIIVLLLILLVLGLYFFTEPTKGIIRVTGRAAAAVTKEVINDVRTSQEYAQLKDDIKNQTMESLQKINGG
ncbi:MAG: hypothetical protein KKC75_03640 [Nanoarchaeota archaeon]|nr:hypothetical protein [Nanoarchaeota archaeon]MBU1005109.1 hypothetical protein [Nanoarchaeota archaeon]MBU1945437.1 hypothetical protein [Nanoarchaeota archaeon]